MALAGVQWQVVWPQVTHAPSGGCAALSWNACSDTHLMNRNLLQAKGSEVGVTHWRTDQGNLSTGGDLTSCMQPARA